MGPALSYSERRPYAEPPERISDLTGPTSGHGKLPITIDWGGARSYDLGSEADRRILYERVLREAASTAEVCEWVDGAALVALWSQLWLPQRLRRRWEDAFPELRQPAA